MTRALAVESLTVTYLRPNRGQTDGGLLTRAGIFNGRRERVHALKGVSFDAHEGQIVGIVGANGAGKSSLMGALAQEIPHEGVIRARARPRLVKMGRLLPRTLTGRQQIELVVRSLLTMAATGESNQPTDAAALTSWIESAIAFADLGTAVDAPVGSYSKGMRSRLNFAALTVGSPAVLLVDEALAVGDDRFVGRAGDRVEELAANGTAVLICDHSTRRLKKFCNRAVLLDEGTIVEDGPVREVLDVYSERLLTGGR